MTTDRNALETVREFIRGEQIEHAMVDAAAMLSLGGLIDAALRQPPSDASPRAPSEVQESMRHLRLLLENLDGKYICTQADDGFIDEGFIVASDYDVDGILSLLSRPDPYAIEEGFKPLIDDMLDWDAAWNSSEGSKAQEAKVKYRAARKALMDAILALSPAPAAAPTLEMNSPAWLAKAIEDGRLCLIWCDPKWPASDASDEQRATVVAALTAPDKGGPDERAALIRISDLDWGWEGGGSKVRHRGPCGKIAAKALGIPDDLPLGWPDHKSSETEAALARSVAETDPPLETKTPVVI